VSFRREKDGGQEGPNSSPKWGLANTLLDYKKEGGGSILFRRITQKREEERALINPMLKSEGNSEVDLDPDAGEQAAYSNIRSKMFLSGVKGKSGGVKRNVKRGKRHAISNARWKRENPFVYQRTITNTEGGGILLHNRCQSQKSPRAMAIPRKQVSTGKGGGVKAYIESYLMVGKSCSKGGVKDVSRRRKNDGSGIKTFNRTVTEMVKEKEIPFDSEKGSKKYPEEAREKEGKLY